MADKQSLEFTGSLTVEATAAYLEALAQGLREGHVYIEAAGEFIDLEVGDDIALELEASASDKGKTSLEVSLAWRAAKRPVEVAPGLVIRSAAVGEPVAEEAPVAQPSAEEPTGSYGSEG